jgi:hypothetical protein
LKYPRETAAKYPANWACGNHFSCNLTATVLEAALVEEPSNMPPTARPDRAMAVRTALFFITFLLQNKN